MIVHNSITEGVYIHLYVSLRYAGPSNSNTTATFVSGAPQIANVPHTFADFTPGSIVISSIEPPLSNFLLLESTCVLAVEVAQTEEVMEASIL